MACSLSNLVNNLAKGIHKSKCEYGDNDKKCETYRIKYKDCNCFFKNTNFKDNLIEHKCLCCNKNYQEKFDENLKERFFNTYTFSSHGINNFISLLRKAVDPYEHMDD